MQGVKREESCSCHICRGNNGDNRDDTNVVNRFLLSNLVEQSGNDRRDGRGGGGRSGAGEYWLQQQQQGRMLESAQLQC